MATTVANMPLKCPCCLFAFDNVYWLVSHLRELGTQDPTIHGQFDYCCAFCSSNQAEKDLSAARMQQQQQYHHSANKFAEHLERYHLLTTTNADCEQPFDCNANKQEYIQQRQPLYEHIIADGPSATEDTNIIAKPLKIGYAARQYTSNGAEEEDVKRYQCQLCTRQFLRSADLKRHVRTHTDERPFLCPSCQQTFKLKQTLDMHMETHRIGPEVAQQHKCLVCNKYFMSRSALKLHLRIHTGEKPFGCVEPGCVEKFRTKRLMLTHHRVSHQMPEQADGIIALDALLALNDRIGKPNNTKTAKIVVHSEHSAFVKYGTNGHTSHSSNGGGTSTISASDIDNTGRNIMNICELGHTFTAASHQQQHHPHPSESIQHQHELHLPIAEMPNISYKYHNNNHNTGGGKILMVPQQHVVHHHQQQQRFQYQQLAQPQQHQPYFQMMADAEYTRQGQVHCRTEQQPMHQFRTYSPPHSMAAVSAIGVPTTMATATPFPFYNRPIRLIHAEHYS